MLLLGISFNALGSNSFLEVPLVDAVKQIKDLAEVKELLNALSQLKAEVADVKKRAEELDDLKMSLQDFQNSRGPKQYFMVRSLGFICLESNSSQESKTVQFWLLSSANHL